MLILIAPEENPGTRKTAEASTSRLAYSKAHYKIHHSEFSTTFVAHLPYED